MTAPIAALAPTYEVVVIGGGPAGIVAAAQAARAGATTLLVEKTARLGGTTINGGVNFPGLFHAWGRRIIAGIGWELVERTVRESGGPMPDFALAAERHWHHQIWVDMMVYAALADELVLRSGATLLLHTMVAAARPDGSGWRLTLCTKEGLHDVAAGVVIDATGDANVVALAGLPREIPAQTQPATLVFRLEGYDPDQLDLPAIDQAFAAAVAAGELLASDGGWHADHPQVSRLLRSRGGNANHIKVDASSRDSLGRTAAEVAGRAAVLRLFHFLRRQQGLAQVKVSWVAAEVGIRETATIVGETTITLDDYMSGRVFPEALCYVFYPIDLHGLDTSSWQTPKLAPGTVATVPRGALVPRGSRNLLVAGRCVASDRLANSALRVQVSAMAMGQAAGALAVVAIRTGQPVGQVALAPVRELLRAHAAIVPDPPAAG